MDRLDCKDRRIVKEVSLDLNLICSLRKTSKDKLESQDLLFLSSTILSSKLSLDYDPLRELLKALILERGFRIYNYKYYTVFLKGIIEDPSLGDSFDEIRRLRNSINYYGKQVTVEDCKINLNEIESLMKITKDYLRKCKN